jgi:ribosomal protein L22
MAPDAQGGKGNPGDVGTKVDQPGEQAGKGTPAKEELETTQAAEALEKAEGAEPSADPGRSGAAAEDAPKPKPRARKKKAEPEAEGTAAAETEIDKDAAEAETKPARKRGSRGGRGRAKEPVAEEAPPKEDPRPRRAAERVNGAAPVVRAQAKYVRTSARKARLVCDHIRGKSVDEARAILAFTPRAVARDWSKLLDSAVANAENNHELVGDDLKVLAAYADEGPTLKRFRPRAMGRATRIRKRTSHLTITLTPKKES